MFCNGGKWHVGVELNPFYVSKCKLQFFSIVFLILWAILPIKWQKFWNFLISKYFVAKFSQIKLVDSIELLILTISSSTHHLAPIITTPISIWRVRCVTSYHRIQKCFAKMRQRHRKKWDKQAQNKAFPMTLK